jgi:hypothetical protein
MPRDKGWWKNRETEIIPSVLLDVEATLPLLRTLNECSIPLYGRKRQNGHPELIGSGVLLVIKEHVFVLTASHVMELLEESGFLLLIDDAFHAITGRGFRTPPPNDGTAADDPIDAAIFDVQEEQRELLIPRCLGLDDLHTFDRGFEILYSVSGYPLKKSRRKGALVKSEPFLISLLGQPPSVYERAQVNRRTHIVMESTKRIMGPRGIKKAPTTTGMSGGPVFIVPAFRNSPLKPKLVGIFIERRKIPPIMIATSVAVHLTLIARAFPDLRLPITSHETEVDLDDWAAQTEAENIQAKSHLAPELRTLVGP